MDEVNKSPVASVRKVFEGFHLDDLRIELKQWFEVGISSDNSVYEDGENRSNLIRFNGALQILVEAFHVFNSLHQPKSVKDRLEQLPPEIRKELQERNQPTNLSAEEVNNPMLAIKQFCRVFKREYAIRELWDWLEAVITYDGEYPKGVYKGYVLVFYEYILCLIEAAFVLSSK
jgi:hypothetical protein